MDEGEKIRALMPNRAVDKVTWFSTGSSDRSREMVISGGWVASEQLGDRHPKKNLEVWALITASSEVVRAEERGWVGCLLIV